MRLLVTTNETTTITYLIEVTTLEQIPANLRAILVGNVKPLEGQNPLATVSIKSLQVLPDVVPVK